MKKLIEGPLGFKCTEEQARRLDEVLKSLPKEPAYGYRKKAVTAEAQFEPGERASIDVITTDSVDKDREVVLPDGIDLESYRRNPIVLYQHLDHQPIGKSLWIKPTGNGLKSKTLYASRPADFVGDFLPDLAFALVQQQILKGRSIGFLTLMIDQPTPEQLQARPDWKDAQIIISKSEMFEYSVVSVPCNDQALQEAVSKGLKEFSSSALETLGIKVPELPAKEQPKPIVRPKRIDADKLAVKMLEQLQIDPDRIAKQVIQALKDRGKV
jgi:hypothetical protein